jgi:hypothetical protein
LNKVITLEAGETISIVSMRRAVIGDGNTDVVSIEDPLFRADETDLVVPVPCSTSEIGRVHVIGG